MGPLPLPSLKQKPANKICFNNACSDGALMNRVSTLVKASYLPLRYKCGESFSPFRSSNSSVTDSFSVCMNCNPPCEMHRLFLLSSDGKPWMARDFCIHGKSNS
jgi:hypothetical protein